MLNVLVFCLVVILLYQSAWYGLSLLKKNSSVADIGWGLGFVVVAWLSWYLGNNWNYRNLLINGLVTIWGLRLALYITIRNWGKDEDRRYKAWREQWGSSWWWRSYLQVFILQGLLLIVISFPVIWVNVGSVLSQSWTDYLGLIVWLVGFTFETVGDYQLLAFKRDSRNKDKILTSGLWRYTRHPNYFGESAMWWGIWLIGIHSSTDPIRWLTLIGPVSITFLLLKVSGVTLMERRFKGSREYIQYQKSTSSFIPWFPKS